MINSNFNPLLSNNLFPLIANEMTYNLNQANNSLLNMNNIPLDYMYMIQYQQAFVKNLQNYELFSQIKSPGQNKEQKDDV